VNVIRPAASPPAQQPGAPNLGVPKPGTPSPGGPSLGDPGLSDPNLGDPNLGDRGIAPLAPAALRAAWRPALLALGLGLLGLGLVFSAEIAAAIRIWDSSTAYNHCWLILPIALWLGWVRRHRLAVLLPAPVPWLALLALPLGAAWLVAERLGIMEGRQLVALALAVLLTVTVLGWRFGRAMAAPLVYLVFLVPFGAFSVPALQHVTALLVEFGLGLTSIPHYIDDLIIEIPVGTFYVAEACAGLRFLIAALAFGALYAFTMFRSPGRRIIVMLLALVVPIIANGIRALGIVLLGHYLGSAEAAAADHLVYGWVFFSAVILLLILAGLPFRQDSGPPPLGALPPPQIPASPARLAAAAVLGTLLIAAGPAAALLMDSAAGEPAPVALAPLVAPEGCVAEAAALHCAGATVAVRLLAFPPRVTWAAVAAERRRQSSGGGDDDNTFSVSQPGQAAWLARQFPGASVATAAWLGARPAGDGLRSRALQALNSIGADGGTGGRPVLAVVTLRPDPATPMGPTRERQVLQAVLEAQAPLVAQARALSAGR